MQRQRLGLGSTIRWGKGRPWLGDASVRAGGGLVRLRGAAMSSSRAAAACAAAQLAPRAAIARGPRNALHGMTAAGIHALQRLLGASTRYLCLTGSGGAGRRAGEGVSAGRDDCGWPSFPKTPLMLRKGESTHKVPTSQRSLKRSHYHTRNRLPSLNTSLQ